MAAECVIGVDLGGTKLLAGVVDARPRRPPSRPAHRPRPRPARAARRDRRRRPGGARAAPAARSRPSASASPALIDQRTRHGRRMAVQPAARRPAVPRRDGRAARAARRGRQRRERRGARRARAPAPRGAPTTSCCSRSAPASAAGWSSAGELYRGCDRRRRGARPHGRSTSTARPCQGNCPNRGCLEAHRLRHRARARGRRLARRARPDSALGRALADGREITGALVTELAHDGDPRRASRRSR